jgi:hypothetical protein
MTVIALDSHLIRALELRAMHAYAPRMRDDQALALRWAMEELTEQLDRLKQLADNRSLSREMFASAAYGVWWITAIDNYCLKNDSAYEARRDHGDSHDYSDGRHRRGTIRGVIYLRDRMTYQMPFMGGTDETPLSPGAAMPDAVLFINPGIAWRSSANLPSPDRSARRGGPDWQEDYDANVAGLGVPTPLFRCLRFFDHEREFSGSLLSEAFNREVDIDQFTIHRKSDGSV